MLKKLLLSVAAAGLIGTAAGCEVYGPEVAVGPAVVAPAPFVVGGFYPYYGYRGFYGYHGFYGGHRGYAYRGYRGFRR